MIGETQLCLTGEGTMDLKETQRQIYQNKLEKHWNVSDIEKRTLPDAG